MKKLLLLAILCSPYFFYGMEGESEDPLASLKERFRQLKGHTDIPDQIELIALRGDHPTDNQTLLETSCDICANPLEESYINALSQRGFRRTYHTHCFLQKCYSQRTCSICKQLLDKIHQFLCKVNIHQVPQEYLPKFFECLQVIKECFRYKANSFNPNVLFHDDKDHIPLFNIHVIEDTLTLLKQKEKTMKRKRKRKQKQRTTIINQMIMEQDKKSHFCEKLMFTGLGLSLGLLWYIIF